MSILTFILGEVCASIKVIELKFIRGVNYHIAPLYEFFTIPLRTFWDIAGKVGFMSILTILLGEVCSSTKAINLKLKKKFRDYQSSPLYEIFNYYIKNVLKHIEISWFYVDFNHSLINWSISSFKEIELLLFYTIL